MNLRFSILAAIVLASATLLAPAQEVSDELLEADMKELREGKWSEERLASVMAGLDERELHMAGGFWIADARAALAGDEAGELSAAALDGIEARWRKSLPKEPRRVAREMIAVAEGLIRARDSEAALEHLDRADVALTLWPDAGAAKRCARSRAKLKRMKGSASEHPASLVRKQDEAKTTWAKAIERWVKRGASEFGKHGTAEGYRLVRALATAERHAPVRKQLRADAIELGLEARLTRPARLWIMGSPTAIVWLDGEKVGASAGASPFGRSAKTAKKRGPIDFRVWDDTRLVVTLDPETLPPSMGSRIENMTNAGSVLCYRLEIERKVVTARWMTTTGVRPSDVGKGKLRKASVGKVRRPDRDLDRRLGAGKLIHFGGSRSSLAIPEPRAVAEFFESEEVEGTWIIGRGESPLFVLGPLPR